MDKFFKISEHGSNYRREIIGGLTTFFAMAYIIFVNPSQLCNDFAASISGAMDASYAAGVMVATCIASALGCFLTAFLANVPFAQAPGMGLNAFFTWTCCVVMGYTWQQALTIVLISGILFLIISVSPLRSKIIASIPAGLKSAIGAGIGLFIAFIGLINSGKGIIKLDGDLHITGLNFKLNVLDEAGNVTGSVWNKAALLTIMGVIIIAALMAWKVKGAIFIGIIATTVIALPLGVTSLPTADSFNFNAIGDISKVAFKFDFAGLFGHGVLSLITAIISFLVVDMFDTVGTLIGTAGNAGMLDKNGNLPGGDRALIADAAATCVGACLGTSTVTTYVESSAGISEGARTGLSSVIVGVLFLLGIFLYPIAGIIPGAATAPALIIVGVLMLKSAAKVDWGDIEIAIPAFLTIAIMPFAYSISDGIGFGFISYTIIKMVRGKFKEIPVLMYILSVIFIAMYILKNL
ncbi:MAG: NCS2 family permease [Oscillospiraceae bacterium]|nr:NCS2 family permease [Oscillospiraceae bacterium]